MTERTPALSRQPPAWLRRGIVYALVAVAVFQAAVWAFQALSHFLGLLFLAWLFAISIEPLVHRLERRGMRVLTANTGREAIALLEETPSLAMVLMDIMMPEMDGYQTMQVIRQNPAFRRLPIVALTAKAMKGDREKCLEAGASDYLAKPVNTEQLLSALRMWLHR